MEEPTFCWWNKDQVGSYVVNKDVHTGNSDWPKQEKGLSRLHQYAIPWDWKLEPVLRCLRKLFIKLKV